VEEGLTKPELIAILKKIAEESGGDQEASHGVGEKALLSFVNDPEITEAWKDASQFWWYA